MRVFTLFGIYYASAGYALINPLFGVLFFVHITIFRPENLAWGSAVFGRLHLITAVCTAIGCLIRRDQLRTDVGRHQRLNVALFAAFVAWLWFVSLTATASVDASIDRTLYITKIFAFCVVLSLVLNSAHTIRWYVLVSSASFGLVGFWGVLQGMAGNWRLDNVWVGSNELAAALSLMIPFTLSAALDSAFLKWQRIAMALCVVAMTTCIVYTDSRSGLVALIGGLFGFVVLAKRKFRFLAWLLAIIVLVYPMVPSEFGDRWSTIVQQDAEADLAAKSRPILWQLAFRMWQDNPILGVGLGNFRLVVSSYESKAGDLVNSEAMARLIFGTEREPHGLYPGLLAQAGLLGLALLMTMSLRNASCRLDFQKDLALLGKGAQAGVLGFAIAAIFGDYQYIDMFYWQLFLIGAIRSVWEHSDAGDSLLASPMAHAKGELI